MTSAQTYLETVNDETQSGGICTTYNLYRDGLFEDSFDTEEEGIAALHDVLRDERTPEERLNESFNGLTKQDQIKLTKVAELMAKASKRRN